MRSIVATLSVLMGMSLALVACATPASPTAVPAAPTVAPATPTTAPAAPTTAPATATVPPAIITRVPAAPTAASRLRVTLNTNPADPAMGGIEFIVEVRDAADQPVSDADVQVTAKHTGMGMSISGKATAQGSGRYAVQGNLSMGGSWVVKVEIKKAGMQTFTQEFDLNAMDH